MITIHYACGGCDAVIVRYASAATRSIEQAAPDGWIAFDPWTGCCYCPDCWCDILHPSDADADGYLPPPSLPPGSVTPGGFFEP